MKISFGNRIKKVTAGLLMILMASALTGCQSPLKRAQTSSIFCMNTVMELEIYGPEDRLTDSERIIREIEGLLSVTSKDSDVGIINAQGNAAVSSMTADIITGAMDVCDRTDGALDISIYPVLKEWGFTTGAFRVPSDEEIAALLDKVDYRKIRVDWEADPGPAVTIPEGMEIDLGSVAKGYTGFYLAGYLREMGVRHALLNLGGNVQCIGAKPDGRKWNVAIKSPFEDSKSGMIGVIAADDTAIITSGGYERYFEKDGEIYWHILDPETGKPAKSGLASVTVTGKDGIVCDGMSTALFVKGLDEAIEIWRASDDFEAVFITEAGEVYVTEGLAADFTLTSEYHDAPLQVIKR